jgi:multiple antibiotic resistance protein
MTPWLENFLLAFIPLFVAIDVVGLVPIYLSLADGVGRERRNTLAYQAIATAFIIALGFVFLGQFIFTALRITVADFQIAGGLILLGLAAQDILFQNRRDSYVDRSLGIVPLGMPLIAGPALLTTLLALVDSLGVALTLIALMLNLALVALALRFADQIRRLIGTAAMRAGSRIVALLLAAIAVNFIRRGWQSF